jgi:cytochrome c-550 PedF
LSNGGLGGAMLRRVRHAAQCRLPSAAGDSAAVAQRSGALAARVLAYGLQSKPLMLFQQRTETCPMTPRNFRPIAHLLAAAGLVALASLAGPAVAHGDVTPQAVDTHELPSLGDGWRPVNPYRQNATAIRIGTSAYNQNCARCHGLEAISGGIAPDLRKLDNDCVSIKDEKKKAACVADVDDYYLGSVRRGKVRNGAVYMPPFEGILNQEALWSIKAYLETRREKPL